MDTTAGLSPAHHEAVGFYRVLSLRAFTARLPLLMKGFVCLLLLWAARPLHASFSLSFQGYIHTLNTGGSITLSSPGAVVVDPAGNIFIADTNNSRIVKVDPQGNASVLTISGLPSPSSLSSPAAVALDGAGNLYIADTGNSRVVEVSSSGVGSVISTASVSPAISFPQGIAVDRSGNVFIADTGNSRIVEVPSGGSASALTITVSLGLSSPRGLAVDISGKLYIADSNNNRIVAVAAGSTTGTVVSFGDLTPLSGPSGVAVDRIGNIYVADTGNNRIAEVDTAGAGSDLLLPSIYLQGTTLSSPLGVAVDIFGTVYIADTEGSPSRVLVVDPLLDGDPLSTGYTSSLNKSAVGFGHITLGSSTPTSLILPFTSGFGVPLGGVKVFTAATEGLDFQIVSGTDTTCSGTTPESTSCTIKISFLPTAAGLRTGSLVLYDTSLNPILNLPLYGFSDAPVAAVNPNTGAVISTGSQAIANPYELVLDGAGNMYVGVYSSKNVTKVQAGGGSASVVPLGSPGGTAVQNITGVALDGAGNLFIGDHQGSRVLVVTPGGVVSVLSITGLSPALGFPTALAFDAAGNLYVADFTNGRIIEVSSLKVTGSTSTGKATVIPTGSFSFSGATLTGMTVDSMGNIYAAARTQNNSKIVKVTAAGVASLVSIPNNIAPAISNPQGVGVDPMGNLYIVDTNNNRIVQITIAGVATALGVSGLPSPATTLGPTLFGVTVDPSGNLYIMDWTNNRIVFVNVSGGTLKFTTITKQFTTDTTDGAKTATITNLGNQPLIFSTNPTYTLDFVNNSGDTNPCTSSTSLSAGTLCDVSVNFVPQSIGSISAGITVTNNTLNVEGSTQQVSISGTGSNPGDTTATTVVIAPTALVSGQPATLTATVSDKTDGHTTTIPTGSVTFTDTVGSTTTTLNNGSSVILSGGHATLPGVVLSGIGTHTINANYAGVSGTYLQSSSTTPATATLSKASVTVTGPATQPIAVITGQTGSATVTVTAPYTTISAPTGTLSYSILDASNTSAASGTVTLTAGSASSTATVSIPSTLAAGSYTISIIYNGDGNYLVTSTATTIQVQISQLTPTISWSPAATTISYGATLSGILNASAKSGSSTVPGTFVYTATPSGGSASTVTTATVLAAGSYTLTATFTPTDTTTYKSVSSTISFTVSKATVTLALTSSLNPAVWGGSVAFSFTATSSVGTPTGNVSFYDGTTLLKTAALSSGAASYTLTGLSAGTHSITAVYSGDSNFSSATSSVVSQVVGKASATVALVSSLNPALVTNAVTFTATLSSNAGTPTGSIGFYDGTTLLSTATLSKGSAVLTSSSLAIGAHSITAAYSGDSNFSSVTSSAVAQLVQDFNVTATDSGSGSGSSGSSSNAPTQTVVPGETATYNLALVPTNSSATFPVPITMSVSGLPPGATATVSPQVIPANTVIPNITLSVQLPGSTAELHHEMPLGVKLAPLLLGILLLPFTGRMRKSAGRLRNLTWVFVLALSGTSLLVGLSGCGTKTSGFFAHSQTSYTITVTATAGTLVHNTYVTLTVQ